jgi:sRNA-binding carbon storage regulator CsrA
VTVIEIRDDEVVLAIDAPDWIEVVPEEAAYGAEMMERAGVSIRSP